VALELLLVPELAQEGVGGAACRGLVPGHGAAWTIGAVPAGRRGQRSEWVSGPVCFRCSQTRVSNRAAARKIQILVASSILVF
jgi:hypothetical protein